MKNTLIEANDLVHHLNNTDWVIVDCRFSLADTEEGRRVYKKSHIPGAVYAHLDEDLSAPVIISKTGRHPLPKIKEIKKMFSSWGIDERVQVVVYDDKGGAIAARLWWMLRWLGHEKVAVLNGGWQGWEGRGLPVNDAIPVPRKRIFEANPDQNMLVNADFVEDVNRNVNYVIIDSRATARYEGKEEPIDPVAGHVPGAVNYPFAGNLDLYGFFSPKEVLQECFSAIIGARPVENVVFYCGSGVTACHNILAMNHAGIGMPKLYAGSWSGWIADGRREIG